MLGEYSTEYERSLRLAVRDRKLMHDELCRVPGLRVFPTSTNFVFVKLPDKWSGPGLRDYLVAEHGCLIRETGNKLGATSQYVRLVVRPADDVARLIAGFHEYAQLLEIRATA